MRLFAALLIGGGVAFVVASLGAPSWAIFSTYVLVTFLFDIKMSL